MTALVHTVRGVPERRKNVCWDCRLGTKIAITGVFVCPPDYLICCVCEESTHYGHMLATTHPACRFFKEDAL